MLDAVATVIMVMVNFPAVKDGEVSCPSKGMNGVWVVSSFVSKAKRLCQSSSNLTTRYPRCSRVSCKSPESKAKGQL